MNISFDPKSADRKFCLKSLSELQLLHPKRKFNLLLIDKDLAFIKSIEKDIYRKVYPQITHLDFNIGSVLSFASAGEGLLFGSDAQTQSGARVVLDGLGADELFAGYRRYRTAFLRGSTAEMRREMQFGRRG